MSQPTVMRWLKGIRQLLKYRQLRGKETVKFIGQDHLGNKYYEAFRPNHIRQNQRFFNRPDLDKLEDVVDAAQVPPVWDSWLRFRRNQPPTEEEVRDSEEYFKMQQAMAAARKVQDMDESKQPKTDEELPVANRGPPKRPNRIPLNKDV